MFIESILIGLTWSGRARGSRRSCGARTGMASRKRGSAGGSVLVGRAMLPIPQRATFSRLRPAIAWLTCLFAIAVIGTPVTALAQNGGPTVLASNPGSVGRISGSIVSAADGRPVSEAVLSVVGSEARTVSDLDGNYLLRDVPAGMVDVTVRVIGYTPKRVTGVSVNSETTTTLNISLERVVVALEAITVTAASNESHTAEAMLNMRRTSEAVLESIGSFEIKQIPASDAADVAKRMTGITVNEDRYVYVRGLGDRYSQTTLHGSALPSPEPERAVVPLDLFPSAFLDAVSTQKTYTPDQPGEFSGGAVQIETKDLPEEFYASIGVSTGINTATHFKKGAYLTYAGGGTDWLGRDDGTRAIPQSVLDSGQPMPADPAIRQQLGRDFQRTFDPVAATAPLNRSVDFSLGTRSRVFGKEAGLVLGLTYSDQYKVRDNEIERKYRTSAFDPDIAEDRRAANVDYTFTRGMRNISIGAIGNVSMFLTPTNKLSLRTTFNRNTDDEARTYRGSNNEDLGGLVIGDRLRFVPRQLMWGQLSGEHQTFASSILEWRATLAKATRDEPALRETIYLNTVRDTTAPYYLENVGESGRYLWNALNDNDKNLELDWRFPFSPWNDLMASVKFGAAWRDRTRDFEARRFAWNFLRQLSEDIEEDLTDDNIVGELPGPHEFAIREVIEPGDDYNVYDKRGAAYVMAEVPFTGHLRSVFGARVENYNMRLESRGDTLSGLDETSVLPAVTLIYDLSQNMNVRLAYAGTVDRPEFRELAPFQFTEASSLRQIYGNPLLEVATIKSLDLRWDWFRGSSNLLSLSAFYKDLKKPIERVFIAAASTAYSYQNASDGKIYGVELDARQRLGEYGLWQSFMLQGNLALINSEVNVVESGTFQPTNLQRPLEGQSSYSLNLGAIYQSESGNSEFGVFYSRFGQRLAAAGGFGVPDIYEQPRDVIDLNFRQRLAGGLGVSMKASNLLNQPYRWTQEANGIVQVQREYRTGANFSVGLKYEF